MRQNWTFIDLFCTSFAKVHSLQNLSFLFRHFTSLLSGWEIAARVPNGAAVDNLFADLAVIFLKSAQELTGYLFTQFILRNTAILNKVIA